MMMPRAGGPHRVLEHRHVGDEVGVGAGEQHVAELGHRLVPHLLSIDLVVVVVTAPRVVDQHVDAAVTGQHVVDQAAYGVGVGVVADHRLGRAAGLRDQLDRALHGQVGHARLGRGARLAAAGRDHVGACGRQLERDGPAQPTRGAGDQGDLVLERRLCHDDTASRETTDSAGSPLRSPLVEEVALQPSRNPVTASSAGRLRAVSETFDVLVVCLGNLCRSPLAERLLRLRLADEPGVRVSSAGVRAVVGAPMDASAALELSRLGGDPSDFVARQLTADLVTDADLVLTATRQLRSQVVELAPTALRRTFTLRELAALLEERPWPGDPADLRALVAAAADWRGSVAGRGDALDVPDPIGGPASLHREAADLAARGHRRGGRRGGPRPPPILLTRGGDVEPVSARAWSELLHAEVGTLLRLAGVPCLHIKGPTVATWLYDEGERAVGRRGHPGVPDPHGRRPRGADRLRLRLPRPRTALAHQRGPRDHPLARPGRRPGPVRGRRGRRAPPLPGHRGRSRAGLRGAVAPARAGHLGAARRLVPRPDHPRAARRAERRSRPAQRPRPRGPAPAGGLGRRPRLGTCDRPGHASGRPGVPPGRASSSTRTAATSSRAPRSPT